MKKVIFLLLVSVLLMALVSQYNNSPGVVISGLLKKGGIKSGDLKYRINLFGVIPVGEAVFYREKEVEYGGHKVYHLRAEASVLKWLSKFFAGSAAFDSYVDKKSLNPLLFKQKIKALGKENPDKEIFYNHKDGTMTLGGIERTIFPNTQDPLSAIFSLRRADFENTDKIEININTNQKNYILSGKTKRKELSVRKEIYKTVSVEAQVKRRDKDSYHKSNISMVLLEAEENIPVLIKVFASGVIINVKLISISR